MHEELKSFCGSLFFLQPDQKASVPLSKDGLIEESGSFSHHAKLVLRLVQASIAVDQHQHVRRYRENFSPNQMTRNQSRSFSFEIFQRCQATGMRKALVFRFTTSLKGQGANPITETVPEFS